MKKKLVLAALLPLAALAEDATPTMDVTKAKEMANSATTGLSTLLAQVQPYIVSLVLACLAVWAGFKLIGLIKRVWNRAN